MSISSGTGEGEHIELSISGGNLYISRNGGQPELVGAVNGSTDGIGVNNIAFRVTNGNLQYRLSVNNV